MRKREIREIGGSRKTGEGKEGEASTEIRVSCKVS